MKLAQFKATDKTPRRQGKARLSEHRLFAPVWGLWGTALGGLSVLVMPRALIWQQLGGVAAEFSVTAVRLGMAMLAAMLLGLICFGIAYAFHRMAVRKGKRASVAEMAEQRVRPIDPANELGSDHFDAPVETMPFGLGSSSDDDIGKSDTAGWLPRDEDEVVAGIAAWSTPAQRDADHVANDAPAPETPPAPRELDLAEFAQLPGRNAVWVEEPAGDIAEVDAPVAVAEAPSPEPAPAPAPAPALPTSPPVTAAVARLREVPPADLSLVQMVERFAAALHDHQTKAQDRALQAQSGSSAARLQRDAALAEALRALSLFTEKGLAEMDGSASGSEVQDDLRNAMMKLQSLRGVA